ncbi:MAG: hypothetical protein HEQ25_08505 [Dolichospermum sp. DET73]|nr:hypothetical protein [Dolichospermum sp. DET73]
MNFVGGGHLIPEQFNLRIYLGQFIPRRKPPAQQVKTGLNSSGQDCYQHHDCIGANRFIVGHIF